MYRWEITRAALDQRVVALVRGESYDHAAATAGTLLSAGITSLEISLTTPFALEVVTTLAREVGDEALIGAGAVLDGASARLAVDAGARFLSSPGLRTSVVRTGHRYGVPVFPGVATPAEILRAMELGADALRLFPAPARHPRWLTEVRAELPQVYKRQAGAVACALGTELSEGDRDTVAKRVGELLGRLEDAVPRPGR